MNDPNTGLRIGPYGCKPINDNDIIMEKLYWNQ